MPAVQTQKQKLSKKERLPDVIEQLEASLKAGLEGRIRRTSGKSKTPDVLEQIERSLEDIKHGRVRKWDSDY